MSEGVFKLQSLCCDMFMVFRMRDGKLCRLPLVQTEIADKS